MKIFRKEKTDPWSDGAGKWLPYFAWKPVRIDNNELRWMEWVERKIVCLSFSADYWEISYRAIIK